MSKIGKFRTKQLRSCNQMHVHHWRPYGPSLNGQTIYVMCTNRTRWTCPDCEKIPCICAMSYSLEEWEKMPHG